MNKIIKIQKFLKKNKYNIFLINRTDEFLGEYIANYAERLNWLTGFSGSAGRAIITQNSAELFVDGRYTFQAKKEINLKLIKINHLNHYWDYLKKLKNQNIKIIIDIRLHSVQEVIKIQKLFLKSKIKVHFLKKNPIDDLWNNQPTYPNSKIFEHPLKYAGKTREYKIKLFRSKLQNNKIDYFILSSLDSIAWLLNIRGNDIDLTPLAFAYLLIPKRGKLTLFCNIKKIEENLKRKLKGLCYLKDFTDIKKEFSSIPKFQFVSMDYSNTPFYFKDLCESISLKTLHIKNPCIELKASKNLTELKGAKRANIRDGISIVKFLYWLKSKKNLKNISEIKVADYLLALRKKNKLFYSLSFDTISAFGKHSALPHYRVSKNSNYQLKKNNIYLCDSGGQYKDGTTDITRTIILGNPSEEMKDRFTRVLKGHIAISTKIFRKGTTGSDIDHLARKSLIEIGCDYDHGTGHGIGSFLSVHEGPQRISKKLKVRDAILKQGMIISNEPGFYSENKYGIRIENLLIVKKKYSNYLQFETISFAPIDIDLIKIDLLTQNEIEWINNYHNQVYQKVSKYISKRERKWLKLVTNPLKY
tara:strand:+ start:12457 stop:14217 length:1761 start_codon:yes stop_codon:yes gene_type:complete